MFGYLKPKRLSELVKVFSDVCADAAVTNAAINVVAKKKNQRFIV
jgi:hypothetical protein